MTALTLQVEHVTKRYGAGATEVTAVHDVSLAVAPGEVVLIMGPSGSGKTTLLSMLGALLRPTEGTVRLDGTAISALSEGRLPEIRLRQFGFIFQDFNLLSALTALENVAVVAQLAGKRDGEARARAEALLTELGMAERLHFLPEKLSGGEKQRVAIARALVNEPALILADEPTANLDSKIGREIMRLLQRIARERGRSVVIVSHDQRIREIADRVLWLEDGRFKAIAAMATDPVCGMSVEVDRAVPGEWRGRQIGFCSNGCRAEFATAPERFAAALGEPPGPGSGEGPVAAGGAGATASADPPVVRPAGRRRARSPYERIAPLYDLINWPANHGREGAWRRRLWERVAEDAARLAPASRPRLIEVGVGTGANLEGCPPEAEVTAIDLSPRMLARARTRARRRGRAVRLLVADAQALPFPDASFDLAVATCVFCSVGDPLAALQELRRVVRPGGRLHALEHGLSGHRAIDTVLRRLSPLSRRLLGPALDRDPVANLERAGWRIVEREDHLAGIFHSLVAERAE